MTAGGGLLGAPLTILIGFLRCVSVAGWLEREIWSFSTHIVLMLTIAILGFLGQNFER